MKKIITLLACIAVGTYSFAQNAQEATVEALKATQPCVVANFNYTADLMEDALAKKLSEAKLGKGDKSKGYRVYKGVVLPEISADKIDIYTKVDGNKNSSSVYMLVSKGYDNFISGAKDSVGIANMKRFLNSLEANAVSMQLLLDIEKAQDEYKKAENKRTDAIDAGKDLEKEKAKIEKEISDNKILQEARVKQSAESKAKLDALKALIKQ